MLEMGGPLILSRRNLLMLVGGGLAAWRPLHATTSGFWNKKPPQDWSSEEIDALITKSPWAKEASAQGAAPEGGYGSQTGSPNGGGMGMPRIGIPGIGGIGMGGGGGRRMGGNQGGGRGQQRGAVYHGTVRWESAQPVLDALKAPLPDAFANHYVIAVIGFPLPASERRYRDEQGDNPPRQSQDDMLDNLKQFTTLQPKGKELAQAGVVQQQTSSNSDLLFGFSKDSLTLTKDDKEVLFSTTLGRMVIRAKFDPKEMLYHGQLAV